MDCIVVVEGLGFYMGLCVVVVIVKMLVYMFKIDLVGVFSLYVLINGFLENDLLVLFIDVWCNNVYVGFY